MLDFSHMFQIGLIIKLGFFYMVAGMNTRTDYKFMVIAFCIGYYFYQIKEIYRQHYSQQMRRLQETRPPASEQQNDPNADARNQHVVTIIQNRIQRYVTQ